MDSVITIYNGLNKTGKIIYLYRLKLTLDVIEGKEIKKSMDIKPTSDRGATLVYYEAFLPQIKDPEIKAKCERFIKLRKENIALLEELGL
jgi:hypothetical protein